MMTVIVLVTAASLIATSLEKLERCVTYDASITQSTCRRFAGVGGHICMSRLDVRIRCIYGRVAGNISQRRRIRDVKESS